MCIDKPELKVPPPKFIKQTIQSKEAMDNLNHELIDVNITNKICTNPFSNPNANYEILEDIITKARALQFESTLIR